MDRRSFLKAAGLGSIAFAYGCNPNQDKHLYSLVRAPEDMVTGKPAWYATTCSECPAGCGILAKNREGRIVKLEGNPLHPVNKGKLCIRGQASLQEIYDPDRLILPKLKTNGQFKTVAFDQAFELLKEKIQTAANGGGNRIKMISGLVGEPLYDLFSKSLRSWKADPPLLFEPYSRDALKKAHQSLFGSAIVPSYRLEKSDFILGFGADFLETWLSPVEYAGKFKSMHGLKNDKKGFYLHVGPYMSLTAANADKFISVEPDREVFVALGLINRLLESNRFEHLPADFMDKLKSLTDPYDPQSVEKLAGISITDQKTTLRKLLAAGRPLVLGGGSPTPTSFALETACATINLMLDPKLSLYDFDSRHAIEKAASLGQVLQFVRQAKTDNSTDVLLFYRTNPRYALPTNTDLQELVKNENIFKVSFSAFMDETAAVADLIFPVRLSLEVWDAYESRTNMVSSFQPAMGRLTEAPPIGDIFLGLSDLGETYENYQHFLMERLFPNAEKQPDRQWLSMVQNGGMFETVGVPEKSDFTPNSASLEQVKESLRSESQSQETNLKFLTVPSLRYYDGRGSNKPWLNEIPDPITGIAWESLCIMHPDTLVQKGLKQGDIVRVEGGKNAVQAPVYSYSGVQKNLVVMQAGLGHRNYGRFAEKNGSNPFELLTYQAHPEFGAVSFLRPVSKLKKLGAAKRLPQTDGSRSQYQRKIAVSLTAGQAKDVHHPKEGLTMNDFPLTLPTKEGYSEKRDVYPPHEHEGYRWGMIIDLDRCIGCSACAAACYAENNVAVVGKKQLSMGREMAWLRIERYEDQTDKEKLIFLPMLCQHCDNAPCEAVCPVYAPYHTKEGLNAQIYNRCVGTRFCAQNCPYKVRRFNWHDWEFPKPLNLQLNPNVTVRMRGVMEKCSFCVQRIKEAHNNAKNENRKIRDGEVQPACVQTCPTNALAFGDFLDKNSTVYKMAKDSRAYQVLGYLNTKPAVIYLKKVLQEV